MRNDTNKPDQYGPHYNLEIRNAPGGVPTGPDLYNFHIRYLGVRTNPADGLPYHYFIVDDNIKGTTFIKPIRAYTGDGYECQEAAQVAAWEIATELSALDPANPTSLQVMTQNTPNGDTSYLEAALQDLCGQPPSIPPPSVANSVGQPVTVSASTSQKPAINPASQSVTSPSPATFSLSMNEDPTRPLTVLLSYGDNNFDFVSVPQGSTLYTVGITHAYGREGIYDGSKYHQTFIVAATVRETRAESFATVDHTCW